MTNLENEIKEAFEKDQINLSPKDILKQCHTSFVSKKRQISLKESLFITVGNFAVAAAVFCFSLISPLNYQESIEDSIESRDFASHIVGALGFSNFTTHFYDEPSDFLPEAIEQRALPPIAFLNYSYTNKDKINYSFSSQERRINNQLFEVKETINDRFLDTQYDVFFKKKNDKALSGCVFENHSERVSLNPIFYLDIESDENNRDCFLDIDFKPTDKNFEHLVFNIKENYDNSIQFTLFEEYSELAKSSNDKQRENLFECKFEPKEKYNLFTLKWKSLETPIQLKIYNKYNMKYDCVYSSENAPTEEMNYPYVFNNDGTIEENTNI